MEQRPFLEEDVHGALLIFATTDNKRVNRKIKESVQPHQLVTMADDPECSDFHVPASMKRGRLSIAVSTCGASPTLARKITDTLKDQYDERYEEYLEFLFQARQKVLSQIAEPVVKRKLLSALTEPSFLEDENRNATFGRLLAEAQRE